MPECCATGAPIFSFLHASGATCLQRRAFSSHERPLSHHQIAQGAGIVQGLFGSRVRKVEPVLDKVDAQHAFDTDGAASGLFRFGIEWLDGIAQFPLGNNGLHVFEKPFLACFLGVLVESAIRKRSLARGIHPVMTMICIINEWTN